MDIVYHLDGDPPEAELLLAAQVGDVQEMKRLAELGVDINWQGHWTKRSSLHIASGGSSVEALRFLLDLRAKLEIRDYNDMTPLMTACGSGAEDNAALLLEAGADVNAVRQDDEMTPLKFAVGGFSAKGVQRLLIAGAELNGVENDGFTPLMLAARHNNAEAIEVLVSAGANVDVPCNLRWAEGLTAEGLAKLEKRRTSLAAFKMLRKRGLID